MDKSEILKVIDDRVAQMGWTIAEASEAAVGNATLISNMRRARYGMPSVENLEKLARVLNLELYFGPKRTPAQPTTLPKVEVNGDDFVAVPLYHAHAAAGMGAQNDTEQVERHILFRRDWLRGLGVALPNAALLRARGDSMHPVIQDGDLMMIDTSQTEVLPARKRTVWVIRSDGDLRVKWIHRSDDKTLVVTSTDHELYPPVVLKARDGIHHSLLGRVVWWGHSERY